MLSLEQIKKLLNDPTISDDQALEIRDQFYALAEIIYEQWQEERKRKRMQNNDSKTSQSDQ